MHLTRPLFLCVLGLAGFAFGQTAGVDSPQGDLVRGSDGAFYGTSSLGGLHNQGAIFKVTPESEVSVAVSFTGDEGTVPGAGPNAGMVDDGTGVLWGTTEQGGAFGFGTVFKFSPATGVFTTIIEFSGIDGSLPCGGLASDGAGMLWGTTRAGGDNDLGTIFKLDAATGVLSTVNHFTGASGAATGAEPKGRLVLVEGRWWGTTSKGGPLGLGTVFSIDPTNGNAFTPDIVFTGTNGDRMGSAPEAGLIADAAGRLWGTTTKGGTSDRGTIFRFEPGTTTFRTVVNFDGAIGAYPKAALRFADGSMWGTTFAGGGDDQGTIFAINLADDVHSVVATFSGTGGAVHGAYPLAGLVPGETGELWGVASQGGVDDRGTIFKVLTATAGFQLVAEPEAAPVAPTSTVQKVPVTATNVPLGTPVTLRGTAKDNDILVSVVVSINGGPFLPATLTPPIAEGKPFTWTIDVLPQNGLNVVLIKSVDNGGNGGKPVKLTFSYTITRPELAGSYAGVIVPDQSISTTPHTHGGAFNVKVTATGRFTGQLILGGRATKVLLSGAIGNTGAARFGKSGVEQLAIARKNQVPLTFSLQLDPAGPPRKVTGGLHERGVMFGEVRGGQALYTAKANPAAPLKNVPPTLLDPLSDKGRYTVLLRALNPVDQGRPATEYPQGDGYATMRIKPTGAVAVTGRLADGTPFAASHPVILDTFLPLFAKMNNGNSTLAGMVEFRDQAQSDADGTDLVWVRRENLRATNYRAGWPDGIRTDFIASRFVVPLAGSGTTALGNGASSSSANALLTLRDGHLPGQLNSLLAISEGGATLVVGAPVGGTATAGLKFSLLKSGLIAGSFLHPGSATAIALRGAVLQKSQVGGGYFLAPPVGGASDDPKDGGRLELQAQ